MYVTAQDFDYDRFLEALLINGRLFLHHRCRAEQHKQTKEAAPNKSVASDVAPSPSIPIRAPSRLPWEADEGSWNADTSPRRQGLPRSSVSVARSQKCDNKHRAGNKARNSRRGEKIYRRRASHIILGQYLSPSGT